MIEILNGRELYMVEDNQDDALLAMRHLQRSGLTNPIRHFFTPESATHYMFETGERPVLILLDLKFPGSVSGVQWLRDTRKIGSLVTVPVVVVTGSDNLEEIVRDLGATAYIQKPVTAVGLLACLHGLDLNWTINALISA